MKFFSKKVWKSAGLTLVVLLGLGRYAAAQADQGSISGVIQDPSGAVIRNASVTLNSVDTGQELQTKSDSAGLYVFSPVKIGNYTLTVSSPGFEIITQTNLHVSVQQSLNMPITLKPGATTTSITVTSAAPILQTQESSVGQVLDTQALKSIPLSGGNWTYAAQLSAGTVPAQGSETTGTGSFNANGQRAEQNSYLLDGVDNNSYLVSFLSGAIYSELPPTEALEEFKVQTVNYSAEFGHSAGAVINASLKSGTNSIHGSVWEYLRNTVLDAKDWEAASVPVYHENQFGATLGLPIIHNKLFFFGDMQANRIAYASTAIDTIPSALERTGDFSELLSPSLTGKTAPIQLYYQNSTVGPQPFPNNNVANGLPGVVPNATALALLNLFPKPNTNNGLLYSNYLFNTSDTDNTFQWDARFDWNIGQKDTAYSRFSYWHEPTTFPAPLGPLEGGAEASRNTVADNFMLSETHILTPTLTNEFRIASNVMYSSELQSDASNANYAASLGVGGIPLGLLNGGLPQFSLTGISTFGTSGWQPTYERENVYQILDNVIKTVGKHSIKMGVGFQSIRFSTLQPSASRGDYNYTGEYTSNLNASNTGSSMADLLLDSQNSASLSNEVTNGDALWYDDAYVQDDWRVMRDLTVNLGLRWDHFQPYQDVGGYQAAYNMTGPVSLNTTTGYGSGSAQYQIPIEAQSYAESIFTQTNNLFPDLLAKDNITLRYTSNPYIITAQKTNFAPRLGIAYSLNSHTVIRAGYGLFYGGLETGGYYGNLGENYPFQYDSNFPSGSCSPTSCPTDGITLANGFNTILANGFANNVSDLALRGSDPSPKTPYSQSFNLSVERYLIDGIFATVGYVGTNAHHLDADALDPNAPLALENPSNSTQNARPLPDFGGSSYIDDVGNSNYNGLLTKLEKRYSNGNSLLATYTWSHARDNAPAQITTTNLDNQYRQPALIPISMEYANSTFDTRQRFTFAGLYELPFGERRKFLNRNGLLNAIVGGWSTETIFAAQTGNPFTVYESGIAAVSGAQGKGVAAVKTRDPYADGGSFVSPNPNIQVICAAKTRTRANWYNPCSFENPWDPSDWQYEPGHYIPTGPSDPHYAAASQPVYVTSLQSALGFLGDRRDEVYGPGYERVNMSIFKDFSVFREQKLQFRTDIFNLLNTPSLGMPTDFTLDSTGGNITGPRSFQNLTPDARFVQFSMKYAF